MKSITKQSLISFLFITLFFSCSKVENQVKEYDGYWPNGAMAAIALTYDDGLPSHIHTVAPMLKKYDFTATFYPTISSPSLYAEMELWRDLTNQGHELGNHSVYHPCRKSIEGMEWVKDHLDLDNYTLDQFSEELVVANSYLKALDGQEERTLAYPCSHTLVGGENGIDVIKPLFYAARLSTQDAKPVASMDEVNFYEIPSWSATDRNAQELIKYIQRVINQETFSAITFHGVGDEYLRVTAEAHEEMLEFLDENRDQIWVAPLKEITDHINSK